MILSKYFPWFVSLWFSWNSDNGRKRSNESIKMLISVRASGMAGKTGKVLVLLFSLTQVYMWSKRSTEKHLWWTCRIFPKSKSINEINVFKMRTDKPEWCVNILGEISSGDCSVASQKRDNVTDLRNRLYLIYATSRWYFLHKCGWEMHKKTARCNQTVEHENLSALRFEGADFILQYIGMKW